MKVTDLSMVWRRRCHCGCSSTPPATTALWLRKNDYKVAAKQAFLRDLVGDAKLRRIPVEDVGAAVGIIVHPPIEGGLGIDAIGRMQGIQVFEHERCSIALGLDTGFRCGSR